MQRTMLAGFVSLHFIVHFFVLCGETSHSIHLVVKYYDFFVFILTMSYRFAFCTQ